MASKLRVLLADDHAVLREGLKRLIDAETDMEVIGESGDGLEAIAAATALFPDVTVIDISMPRLNGMQATERLRTECPSTKVVVLTVHEDKSYLRQVLAAGASGYVLKRAAADELIRAIRVVQSGGMYVDPRSAQKLVDLKSAAKTPSKSGALSGREEAVLRLIAQGYANKEIADQLQLSVKTVETYKTRSMEKLGLRSRVDIVRVAKENGWFL